MHMPPQSAEGPILEATPEDLVGGLLDVLALRDWPVPSESFPEGSALVGGAVRDGLLGRINGSPDLDLVVPEDALGLTRQLARRHGGAVVVLDESRDMARLVVNGWTIDLARRAGTTLEADLWRRDYRINAIGLALGARPTLVDPTGGLEDLRNGWVTAIAEENLIADPLRLLRGIRIAAELRFAIATDTLSLLGQHRALLPNAAPERIQTEIMKLVRARGADQALHQLQTTELLQPWGPDAGSDRSVSAERLTAAEREEALPLLRLTRLVSDQGLKDLRCSRRQIRRCLILRRWQERDDGHGFSTLSESERLRLHTELGDDLPALVVQLAPEHQDQWLMRWRDPTDPLFHPQPAIDGTTLQRELGLPSGPRLGQVLKHLALERAFGRLATPETALMQARQWLHAQPRD